MRTLPLPRFDTTDKSKVNFTLDEFRMIAEGNYDSLAEKIYTVGYYKMFVTNGGKFYCSLIEEDKNDFVGLMYEIPIKATLQCIEKDAKFWERSDGERNCYLGMTIFNLTHLWSLYDCNAAQCRRKNRIGIAGTMSKENNLGNLAN